MEDIKPRIGLDGNPAQDVSTNPKAIERKAREAEVRVRLEAEAKEPLSRSKIERELTKLSQKAPMATIDGRDVFESLNLHGADISGLDLSGLNLSNVNMHGVKAVGTNFTGCLMVNANLYGADLDGAVLEKANAQSANLSEACLCRTTITDANLRKANCHGACYESSQGFDVEEKPLTEKERLVANRRQAEGFKVHVVEAESKVKYFGSTLEGANVTAMESVCKRRMLK